MITAANKKRDCHPEVQPDEGPPKGRCWQARPNLSSGKAHVERRHAASQGLPYFFCPKSPPRIPPTPFAPFAGAVSVCPIAFATSGTKIGFAVVPWIKNGSCPFDCPTDVICDSPPTSPPPLFSLASVVKFNPLFAPIVPFPVMAPIAGSTRFRLLAWIPSG